MKNPVTIFWAILGLILLAAVYVTFLWKPAVTVVPDGKYDQFAQCLKAKGAVFYGAFWCPHCQKAKANFGSSAKLLPYIECSTPDQQGQTQICKDKNITGYPTWTFAGTSTVVTGEQSMEKLAELSQCPLPVTK
jgi:thiol-disulfide isomerase/thioredoxin